MLSTYKKHWETFSRRVVEAGPSCLLMMVKGNVTSITLGHWLVALKTGAITGSLAVIVTVFGNEQIQDNKYVIAGLTGFLTTFADLFVHPSHFGGPTTEAIMTGVGAGLLCLAFSHLREKNEII
jgi:hypothetical protein